MDEPRNAGEDIGRALREAAAVAARAIAQAGEAAAAALKDASTHGGLVLHDPSLDSDVLAHLGHEGPVSSGDDVRVRVHVANPGDTASEPFKLKAAQLKAGKDATIPASAAKPPDHERVIAAGSSDSVPVVVSVPPGTKPGVYKGKLRGGPQPAELRVEVG